MTIKYAVVSARYTFAAIALVATLLTGCFEKPAFKNVDITGAEYARKLELTDQNGKKRSLAEFKGKAVAVFFGFTQCPDVCPSALGELAQVKAALGKDADRLQVIFVTVDPERDTPAILKAYLANFDKQALGLSGSLDETAAAAKEFKVFFQKVRGRTEGSYTMDHTAGSYIIDPAGNIRLFVRHGSNTAWLVDDVKALLN
jgi:protein SCO1